MKKRLFAIFMILCLLSISTTAFAVTIDAEDINTFYQHEDVIIEDIIDTNSVVDVYEFDTYSENEEIAERGVGLFVVTPKWTDKDAGKFQIAFLNAGTGKNMF